MSAKKAPRPERGRQGGLDKAAAEIRRLWGDMPVVDAEHDLRVMILPEDLCGATPKDPCDCVFARACKRLYHSTKILVFRQVAYVDLPDERGVRHVNRFTLTPAMRELVASFDRGDGVIPEAGFIMKRPCASQRLGAYQQSRREQKRRYKDRQKLLGTRSPGQEKGRYRDDPLLLEVRSGTGAVHFSSGKKDPP